ncbi:MAG: rubrerythrin [Phycisphaerae bacterium]|nr:MAG: rubrerythrin [Planctomycetota bacterium]KAB2940725.1 MAG: rubrerythrin [Phycisphaerae bacterium]MBE7458470.1 rubrerythrin [Planctomycetia bacterium]MCK6464898.1 ferritin-like domain-containing protein [Phycisphaerae bacterium]MCL4719213.1 rubrerythrin [Phycisphaerae bacterium]
MNLFDNPQKTGEIVRELTVSYWMEMETIQNYLANSENLDGVRAEEIKKALAADIAAELGHATQLAKRIRVLGGRVPGSLEFKPSQKSMQPPKDSTDVVSVIKGVIDAEDGAIHQYRKIIRLCDGYDYATQDLCITLMENEESHRREFVGFLKEYEK